MNLPFCGRGVCRIEEVEVFGMLRFFLGLFCSPARILKGDETFFKGMAGNVIMREEKCLTCNEVSEMPLLMKIWLSFFYIR